ncbi:CAP domain-containing protein [Nocardioides sp. S-58]|uniref:CAP domain-containing protein n=1 Tax=Nocardioides renjunii TaxID=3095075 RepID=A0ABU5KEU8_9ACTN|nr:CAP domain-containing protein [Nocardioides sp. S-58]MDZ5663492.1 CAP domain-containing protein [Nocardioides sp. S-58]
MRHPRPRSLMTSLALAAAVLCGLPATAQARTWSVPTSVPTSAGDASARSNEGLEDALMVRINEARAQHGLRKIWNFDVCTDQLAERWGARIARTGLLEHRDQSDVIRRCDNSWAGETLVRGASLTPDVMVELWLDSPGHREILLSPRARRAGVAITEDAQGRMIGVVNLVRHN